ncbi:hypothetical protein Lpl43_08850 [Lactiplantibacillus plantarum]|uniref:DUF1642 domain-containing protein n=1 Tax=Lactiplantibacillus plantarum TaxID=1590 RepID=UPI00077E02C0|nr:DUF1642 domain-containing protein [Lactiplantibacillus plantarum]KYK04262.1 hypothetical protein Lpl43_08850 [Lactiplantibacillus plantarum]
MIKVYRKTATIKAERFDGSDEMIERYDMGFQLAPNGKGGAIIKTLEGDLLVHVGDWIATGTNGEHWAIADDVFKKTYAELPVIPEMVSKYIEVVQGEVALYDAMDTVLAGFGTLPNWMSNNQDLFARAWLDGYTVEEEK